MKLTVMQYMVKSGYEGGLYNDDDLEVFVLVNYVTREFADELKTKKLEATKEA